MTKTSKPKAKPRSTPRGGFIVLRRDPGEPRLRAALRPYEHSTAASACAEAEALAARHGSEFVVFHEIGAVSVPKKTEAHNA